MTLKSSNTIKGNTYALILALSFLYLPSNYAQLISTTADKHGVLYESNDRGLTWQDQSKNLPDDVQMSFIEHQGDYLFLATDNYGLFRSNSNQTEWEHIGQDLPTQKVNAIVVRNNVIYIGLYRHGVFVSRDNGNTWSSLNYNIGDKRIGGLALHGSRLIAGTDIGIFALDEGLQQWQHAFKGVQVVSVQQWKDRLICGTNQGTIISDDNGDNWKWSHREGANHYTLVVGDKVFEICISGELFVSENGGDSWEQANYDPWRASYVYSIERLNGTFILSNNYGVHHSIDGGKNWQLVTNINDFIFFDFCVVGNRIYGGTRVPNQ